MVMFMKILIIILSLFMLTGCGNNNENPIVTMEIQDYGTITIELYPEYAPNTVANFISLIESDFYNGLTIHRVVPDFVIQGGDPLGNGTGGPGYTIAGEFQANGYPKNTLSHTRGIISMARSSSYDSAGPQFFIVLDDSAKTSLDTLYAAFGKVTDGMDIIDAIVDDVTITNEVTGQIAEDIIITDVSVDTFGVNYEVEKI